MKLLILDQFSDPGGAQHSLLDLLCEIRGLRWKALLCMPGNGVLFDRARELGFDTERISCGPYRSGSKTLGDAARFLWQTPRLASHVRRMAERANADLIYVNGPRPLPAVPAGIPVVFHSHSYIGPGMIRKLTGYSLRRTNASLIANCEFVADVWRPFVPAERVSVAYNGVRGVDPGRDSASHRAPTLACVGRVATEKGQLDFVQAAQAVHTVIPEARFELIGAPLFAGSADAHYDKAVRAAARGLPIEFRGWVDDVPAALSAVDLLMVPSAPHEATTRVILEAYAAGVPVIAYRSGGIPEVVEDGITGCLAGSAAEMTALAIDLLRRPERRAQMAHAARECWRRRFTVQDYRRELVRLLERAAAHGTSSRPPAPESPRLQESSRSPRG